MSLPIVWSQAARERLAEIVAYIAEHDPDAAESLLRRIGDAAVPLSDHPYLYRPGRLAGTRELVVNANYIVVYKVLADAIRIETVLHARRRYPPQTPGA